MNDFVHVPKRYRNRAANGHDHTAGQLAVPSRIGAQVPADWADAPPPRIPDNVQAFVLGINDAKDGRRHNAYVCSKCDATLHTYERHPGVTPLTMGHQAMLAGSGCPGQFRSEGYPAGDPPAALGPPIVEWYRPSAEQLQTSTPRIVEHVMRGGLLMRRWTP